jgi:hypothetical protein
VWARLLDVRQRFSRELIVLAALVLWTLVPLVLLAGQGGTFNGTYDADVPDHMQYLSFIRESGEHFLISNRFDTVPDRHLFLDPVFALSGLAWKLGASIQLAYLLWLPVGLVILFTGFAAYVRRLLSPDRLAVTIALFLAFFYVAPALPLADWFHWSPQLRFGTQVVGLEVFAGGYAWGSGPGEIAVGLMPLYLLAVECVLDPSRRAEGWSVRRYTIGAGLAGMLASWLHPWQGLTLLAITAGLVLSGRLHRRFLSLAVPVALTAAPIGYFFVLSHTHSSWMTASQSNDFSHVGWWFVLGFAPLLLALPGFRGRGLDTQERILRIWPVAAFAVYFALNRTWFYHSFVGLSLPLAILAVKGWRALRAPRPVCAIAVALITVPGMVFVVQQLVRTRADHFFQPGEYRALAFLNSSPRSGGVLAPVIPLGQAVPAFAGRQTYVGHYYWTPNYANRKALAEALFDGRLAHSPAIQFVRASGAAFLLSDCRRGRADLRAVLGPLIVQTRHFGCATVYDVRPSDSSARAIATAPSGARASPH